MIYSYGPPHTAGQKQGRPARTYIQQLCEDTGCSPKDLPEAMNDREKCCHSWWISKMQSGRENTLEERYAIKFCFKLGINATETYGMLQTAFRPSSLSSEVIRQLRRWKRLWRRSLTRSDKKTSMGPYRSCWNGRTSALQEITSKETRVSCVYDL